jgi:hypothetical protein
MNEHRLKTIYDLTLNSDMTCEIEINKLNSIDYYSLLCKAASNDRLFRFNGNNI